MGETTRIENKLKLTPELDLPSAMGLFDIVEEKRDGHSIVKVTVASGIEKLRAKKVARKVARKSLQNYRDYLQ